MDITTELNYLQSEINFIDQMLQETSKDQVITRLSYEGRKKELIKKINRLQEDETPKMYKRVIGAPFTVKSKDESAEIIKKINSNKEITKYAKCVGLDTEQFTGKINSALFRLGNKLIKYSVDGTFPSMRLTSDTTNNVFTVEFPMEKQQEKVISVVPKVAEVKEEKKVEEIKKPDFIGPIKPIEEVKVEEKAEEIKTIEEEKAEENKVEEPAVEITAPAEKSNPAVENTTSPVEEIPAAENAVDEAIETEKEESTPKRGRKKKTLSI